MDNVARESGERLQELLPGYTEATLPSYVLSSSAYDESRVPAEALAVSGIFNSSLLALIECMSPSAVMKCRSLEDIRQIYFNVHASLPSVVASYLAEPWAEDATGLTPLVFSTVPRLHDTNRGNFYFAGLAYCCV